MLDFYIRILTAYIGILNYVGIKQDDFYVKTLRRDYTSVLYQKRQYFPEMNGFWLWLCSELWVWDSGENIRRRLVWA